jgi:thymidylate synthase (FAD)
MDVSKQSTDNKQGRRTEPVTHQYASEVQDKLENGQKQAYADYSELVDTGLARELARVNLPLSLYTEMYWQIDLHNLFHFLKLRLDGHAQKEIRDYAEVILEITRAVAPAATSSFENYMRNGVNFSGEEMEELRKMLDGKETTLTGKKLDRFKEKIATGKQL